MTKREDDELRKTKHTLNLYAGDMEALRDAFPDLGASAIIRRLVRQQLDSLRAKSSGKVKVELTNG